MPNYRIGPVTGRIELRAMVRADAEAFYKLNSNPDVMRFTGEPPFQSVNEASQAIDQYPDFDTVGYGRWGCYLKGQQQLIGFCGLKYLEDLGEVDLGYRFLPKFWGRGIATETCRASVAFGFKTLNLDHIIGLVLRQNAASIRVLVKSGFQEDGTICYDGIDAMRYCIRSTDFVDGTPE